MIILDENLNDPEIRRTLERCSPEQISDVATLGFGGRDDSQIPRLLHQHQRSLFLTENTSDFWQKPETAPAHGSYCIVCVSKHIVCLILPLLFRTPPFNSRRQRSGVIAQVLTTTAGFAVEYYRKEGQELSKVSLSI